MSARERLLGNFKFPIPPVTTSLDTHHNLLANERPSLASAEMDAEVTTTSPALPCHTAVSPQTTTTTSHLTHPPLPNETTGAEASPHTPCHAPVPSRSSSSSSTTSVTSHSHEQQSNGCLAPSVRIPQEEEVNMEEKGEQRGEERQEQEGRATPSKPPTPSPLTMKREQEPPVSPHPHRQRKRLCRFCCSGVHASERPVPAPQTPQPAPLTPIVPPSPDRVERDRPQCWQRRCRHRPCQTTSGLAPPLTAMAIPAACEPNPDRIDCNRWRRQRSHRRPVIPAPAPTPLPTPPNSPPHSLPLPCPTLPHQSQRSRDHVTREERNRTRCLRGTT